MNESARTTGKDLRSFGLIIAGVTAGLFGLLSPFLHHRSPPLWPWLVAAPLTLAAAVAPSLLRPFHRLWMKLGEVLGWINTRVVMGIVFIIVITPIAFLMRLMKRDPLSRSFDPASSTYRKPSRPSPGKKMEVPF